MGRIASIIAKVRRSIARTKIKRTDLTKTEGDPGPQAEVDLPLEDFEFWARTTRWPAAEVGIKSRASASSPLNSAIATIPLVLGGALCAGIIAAVGLPAWAVLCGLTLPMIIFFGLRLRRWR